ncbi:VWA domain-containing protein [Piscinibacter sp.]|uniref:VWA domain-containing protein n=1 Tax=Piscinibacter sp. TaxID=1903157 RepID=UPI002CD9BB58|nr:VWA domain-containing protein [Albitalea sp.]HUG26018.1 VWA domain-containing protein [Albitalea sp.]
MTFLWPHLLLLALLLPGLVIGYVWLLRRRKKFMVRFSSVALVKQAAGRTMGWRRHVPPALLLLALGALVVATARPMMPVTLPTEQRTVILAMDLSGSMEARDVAPNRFVASQVAAKAFVGGLPRNVRVGVVAYGDDAQLVHLPSIQRDEVKAAIDRLQLQRGTAIGSGILASLAAIFPQAGIDPNEIPGPRTNHRDLRPRAASKPAAAESKPAPPGSYGSAVIVLLTDGQNTVGPDAVEAAQVAAHHGVKVYTVGFGTQQGEILGFEGYSSLVRLDEDTLSQIAGLTRGEYFQASSSAGLARVYEGLTSRFALEKHETEITSLIVACATLIVLLAAGLSLWWFGRAT